MPHVCDALKPWLPVCFCGLLFMLFIPSRQVGAWEFGVSAKNRVPTQMLASVRRAVRLPARYQPATSAVRRLCIGEDVTPMSIADRVEREAVRKGALSGLSGKGKPLNPNPDSQAHVANLHKNMEARAESEMRAYERSGGLSDKVLGGKDQPLPEGHFRDSGRAQAAIRSHVQQSTRK